MVKRSLICEYGVGTNSKSAGKWVRLFELVDQ